MTKKPKRNTNGASLKRFVRHPAAIARDEWLASQNGRRCCNGMAFGQYLQNRLVEAFLAGWEARDRMPNKKLTDDSCH